MSSGSLFVSLLRNRRLSICSSADVPISLLWGSGLNMFECVFVFISCSICLLNSPYCGNSGSSSSNGSMVMFLWRPPRFMNTGPSVVWWLLDIFEFYSLLTS